MPSQSSSQSFTTLDTSWLTCKGVFSLSNNFVIGKKNLYGSLYSVDLVGELVTGCRIKVGENLGNRSNSYPLTIFRLKRLLRSAICGCLTWSTETVVSEVTCG